MKARTGEQRDKHKAQLRFWEDLATLEEEYATKMEARKLERHENRSQKRIDVPDVLEPMSSDISAERKQA